MFQKRNLFLALLLITWLLNLHGFTLSYGAENAGAFLKVGAGARALGMGSAFVAVADDAYASYWNPAGLAQLQDNSIGMMYSERFGRRVKDQFVSVAFPTMSFSVYRTSVGNIPEVKWGADNKPEQIGTFTDEELAGFLSLAFRLEAHLFLGGNAKYIYHKLYGHQATGYGFDVGALVKATSWFYLGVTVRDVHGSVVKWTNESSHEDTIPLSIKTGAAVRLLDNKITVACDVDLSDVDLTKKPLLHIGGEVCPHKVIALRAGFSQHNSSDLPKDCWTAGASFRIGTVQLDYGYTAHTLGDIQRFSLGIFF